MTVLTDNVCECGCGQRTTLNRDTKRPYRFAKGHSPRTANTPREPANQTDLCMCGCGERTPLADRTDARKGWVKGMPKRYLRGHAQRGRFKENRVIEDEQTGCFVWQLCQSHHGYGLVKRNGTMVLAHRWAYEYEVGPIPEGWDVHHKCQNKLCVNPAHLEALSHPEHMRLHRKLEQTHLRLHAALRKKRAAKAAAQQELVRSTQPERRMPLG